jgi:hypothetical protein
MSIIKKIPKMLRMSLSLAALAGGSAYADQSQYAASNRAVMDQARAVIKRGLVVLWLRPDAALFTDRNIPYGATEMFHMEGMTLGQLWVTNES